MAEPVSLNKFRKAKARAENKARADGNAVKFGRSKVQKAADNAAQDKARQQIDQHKRDGETS